MGAPKTEGEGELEDAAFCLLVAEAEDAEKLDAAGSRSSQQQSSAVDLILVDSSFILQALSS